MENVVFTVLLGLFVSFGFIAVLIFLVRPFYKLLKALTDYLNRH